KPAPVAFPRRLARHLQFYCVAPANWPEAGRPPQVRGECSPAPEFSRDVRHIVRRLSPGLAGQIQPTPAGNVVDSIRLSEALRGRATGTIPQHLASQSYSIEKASQLCGKQYQGIAEHRRLAERHEVLPCGLGLEFQPSMSRNSI